MHTIKFSARFCAIATFLIAFPMTSHSGDWPTRPITVVDAFPAGGGTDIAIRSIQNLLQKELGQPIIVENRPGAGGTIGSAYVARAKPDGYTIGIATTSTHATSTSLYTKLPYDPQRDFEYVGFIGTTPYVLAVNNGLGASSVNELIGILKKDPNKYFLASVGAGTVSHLMGEQFKSYAGAALSHVPFRGAAPAYTDLISGQVHLLFDNPVGLAPYVRTGKMKAIAATETNQSLPNVPTFEQQGIKGFTQVLWYGLVFPKGTPNEIVSKLNKALNKVLSEPAIIADMSSRGLTVKPSTGTELKAAAAKDARDWGKIVKNVGVTLD